jgi:hypothetical protein
LALPPVVGCLLHPFYHRSRHIAIYGAGAVSYFFVILDTLIYTSAIQSFNRKSEFITAKQTFGLPKSKKFLIHLKKSALISDEPEARICGLLFFLLLLFRLCGKISFLNFELLFTHPNYSPVGRLLR